MARLSINGTVHEVNVPPDTPLLWALRRIRSVPLKNQDLRKT